MLSLKLQVYGWESPPTDLLELEKRRKTALSTFYDHVDTQPAGSLTIDSPIIKEVVDSHRAHYIAKYAAEEARAQTGGISLANLSGFGEELISESDDMMTGYVSAEGFSRAYPAREFDSFISDLFEYQKGGLISGTTEKDLWETAMGWKKSLFQDAAAVYSASLSPTGAADQALQNTALRGATQLSLLSSELAGLGSQLKGIAEGDLIKGSTLGQLDIGLSDRFKEAEKGLTQIGLGIPGPQTALQITRETAASGTGISAIQGVIGSSTEGGIAKSIASHGAPVQRVAGRVGVMGKKTLSMLIEAGETAARVMR
jgi:hypothetical protein